MDEDFVKKTFDNLKEKNKGLSKGSFDGIQREIDTSCEIKEVLEHLKIKMILKKEDCSKEWNSEDLGI